MIRAWLSDQGFALGPAFALVLFLFVFAGMLLWIFRPGSREHYERNARLPLERDRAASTRSSDPSAPA